MIAASPPPLELVWLRAARAAVVTKHDPQARERAQKQLKATIAAMATAAAPWGPPASELAIDARTELATPGRYHLDQIVATPRKTWLQLLLGWLADRWNDFVKALSKRVKIGAGAESSVGDALVILFVLVVAYVTARLMRSIQLARDSKTVLAPLESARSAHALWVRAGAAAEAADYAAAIRLLFAATVTLLDLRGILDADESATVNQLRASVHARHEGVEVPFVDIARSYTIAAYAERPVDRDDWQRAREAYHILAARVTTT